MRFYSQQSEDKIIYEEIYGKNPHKNGTFIELGAMDGITYSNTKFFQDNFGWYGVLIEPVPELFKRLTINRIGCDCYNYAISEEEGTVDFVGNFATAGMTRTMTDGFRNCWHPNDKNIYKVKSTPIRKLINRNKYSKINLFSIDVEGNELEVLNTFDWDIKVHLILIEISEPGEDNSRYSSGEYHNLENDKKCRELLIKNGFDFIKRIGCNDLWENKNNK